MISTLGRGFAAERILRFWILIMMGGAGALRPGREKAFLVLMMTPCHGVQRNLSNLIETIWVEGAAPLF